MLVFLLSDVAETEGSREGFACLIAPITADNQSIDLQFLKAVDDQSRRGRGSDALACRRTPYPIAQIMSGGINAALQVGSSKNQRRLIGGNDRIAKRLSALTLLDPFP